MLIDIQEELGRQRVKHIVSSYNLDGQQPIQFEAHINELLDRYQPPLVELALVETLVDAWASVPMVRGVEFLNQAHEKLKSWDDHPIVSTLTAEQFSQISGLDPAPVFGKGDRSGQPIARP
jgi:hypothetical protein